ncbi:hypothetical protein A6024_18645 [Rhodovulum sulfidophilum]|uniref:hypothetical protein n=1 Tax=Rhodovulum sulfidophilum TaxID=35806 RepID=UPI0005A972C6|nr:hypothetical protein [Rhodovulum sulfidophilum]ANB35945.1 hypothetical protein A6W98_18835 [Rhodovulum sulfidophilum DSM 1374]ANB39757.1 hypothetical protein A6024_18645 [Rhodovulum sulfidophilum]
MIWRRVMALCGAMEMWLVSPKVGSVRLTGLLPSAWLFALEYPTVHRAFMFFRAMFASAIVQISGVVPPALMAFSGPFPRSGLRWPGAAEPPPAEPVSDRAPGRFWNYLGCRRGVPEMV